MNLKIEKIFAIDTTGKYPVAFVKYEGYSPSWKQYQNNQQIQDYIINNNNHIIINDPYFKY